MPSSIPWDGCEGGVSRPVGKLIHAHQTVPRRHVSQGNIPKGPTAASLLLCSVRIKASHSALNRMFPARGWTSGKHSAVPWRSCGYTQSRSYRISLRCRGWIASATPNTRWDRRPALRVPSSGPRHGMAYSHRIPVVSVESGHADGRGTHLRWPRSPDEADVSRKNTMNPVFAVRDTK
jgi:hypothetical protein